MSLNEDQNSFIDVQEEPEAFESQEGRRRWRDIIFAPTRDGALARDDEEVHKGPFASDIADPGDRHSKNYLGDGAIVSATPSDGSMVKGEVKNAIDDVNEKRGAAPPVGAYQVPQPTPSGPLRSDAHVGMGTTEHGNVGTEDEGPAGDDLSERGEDSETQVGDSGAAAATIRAWQHIGSVTDSSIIGVQISYFIDPSADREIPSEVLRSARSVFVETEAFQAAASSFANQDNVVVLAGQPGSGRKSTALALMADLHSRHKNRIAILPYGGSPDYSARRIPAERGGGYILELPSDDAVDDFKVSPNFGALLASISRILRERGSRLVVVTTSEQWKRIGFNSSCVALEVEPVDGLSIVERRLSKEYGDEVADQWTRHPSVIALLEFEDPWGSVEIFGLIKRTIHDPAPPLTRADRLAFGLGEDSDESEFSRRVLSMVSARRSWRSQLLSWHKERHRTSFHRNFLLAGATLREAPVADLYQGAIDLCSEFEEDGISQLRGQQAPGVIELVDEVAADLTDQDTIRFRRPGWPEAAIEYFWLDRPLYRDKFIQWAAAAALRPVVSNSTRDSAASRIDRADAIAEFVLAWSLRHNQPMLLQELVDKWHNTLVWPAAVRAVTNACFDQHSGRAVHRLLLSWSKSGQPSLLTAVAEVCAGSFGRAYPGKALVRLRHLASSASAETLTAVKEAVQGLWNDLSVRPSLIAEVVAWCGSTDPRRNRSGRFAFAALAEMADSAGVPLLLRQIISNPSDDIARLVTVGWKAILDVDEDKEAQVAATRAWVEVGAFDPIFREPVTEIFLQVVAASRAASFNLQELMYLSFDGPDRERLKPFRQRIHDLDLAQKKGRAVQILSTHRSQDYLENR
ncbi:hypothetical protein [Micromonospora zamorensis]|uniref:hypothetical protein n=1 Tax=Micromonospora zamorensis TaxID=709883 RepID=UPI0033AB5783